MSASLINDENEKIVHELRIRGRARPGGSKRWVGRIIDASPNVGKWKSLVRSQVAKQWGFAPMYTVPVVVNVKFYFTRFDTDYKKRRKGEKERRLKPTAPTHPTSLRFGDLTKLWRSTEDALTGIVWKDDRLVVGSMLSKQYGDRNEVHIQVTAWEG